eukprot:scaffold422979_cov48-Attheya_sp.AAC.2
MGNSAFTKASIDHPEVKKCEPETSCRQNIDIEEMDNRQPCQDEAEDVVTKKVKREQHQQQ